MKQSTKYEVLSTEINLDTFQPKANYILVTIDRDLSDFVVRTPGGIWLDTSYEVEKYAIQTATVVKLPSELVYKPYGHHVERGGEAYLEFDTEVELEVGDQIYFNNLSMVKAIADRRILREGDDYFALIRYDRVYMGLRNGQPVTVNGWHIGKRKVIGMEQPKSGIVLLNAFREAYSNFEVETVKSATPLKESYHAQDYGSDVGFLEDGDIAIVKPGFLNKVEKSILKVNDIDYVRFQEKDVIAKRFMDRIIPNKSYCLVNKLDNPMSKVIIGTERHNNVCKSKVRDYYNHSELVPGEIVYYARSQEKSIEIDGNKLTFVVNVNAVLELNGYKILAA